MRIWFFFFLKQKYLWYYTFKVKYLQIIISSFNFHLYLYMKIIYNISHLLLTFCNFAPSCRKPELEQLQHNQTIFVLFEESTVTFIFIYPLFQIYFPTDSVSHLNIIYSFIIYYFFNNYTSSNIFLFNT